MSSGPLDYRALADQTDRFKGQFFKVTKDPMDPVYGPHANIWQVLVLAEDALRSSYVMSLPFSREEIEESKSWDRVAVVGEPVYWELDPSVPVEKIEGRRVRYPPKGLRLEIPKKEWFEQMVRTTVHQASFNVEDIETVYKGKSETQVRDILKQKMSPKMREDRMQISSGRVHAPMFDNEKGVKFWLGTKTGRMKKTSWKPQALLVDDWNKNLKTNGSYQLRDYMRTYYPAMDVFGKLIRHESEDGADFVLKPDSLHARWGGSLGIEGWFGKEGFFIGATPD